jgi:asparagine synthetase B (glutamine-hydrolysing)
MCGIGGFSLSKNSKINARKLSNALLTELDVRGDQASGFAYQLGKEQGVFKKDTAGSRLSLKTMPRDARNVILHTRYATHGSTSDMANNHPIQSPDRTIDLVHNGVIYNHDLLRKELEFKLPEVDTSVIPALLQQYERDTNKFSMLDGDASIAWLDRKNRNELRLARISHSPLVIAQLKDGSFVFASTMSILQKALDRLHLKTTFIQEVSERTMLTVRDGRIDGMESLPAQDPAYADTRFTDYGYYRGMTSGGYSKSSQAPKVFQSLWGDVILPEDSDYALPEFPIVQGLFSNEYGEYFDRQGYYVGTVEDLYDMGVICEDGPEACWDEFIYSNDYISTKN